MPLFFVCPTRNGRAPATNSWCDELPSPLLLTLPLSVIARSVLHQKVCGRAVFAYGHQPTMTFQPDGGDVPLSWGQFLIKANKSSKTAPRTKTTKKSKGMPRFGNLQQRVAVALLIPLNLGLIGINWTNHSQAAQVEQTRQVQALVAPTPVADSVQIQPIQEPTAMVASVEVEKVEPTPTPTTAVAAVSVSKSAPLVGNWDSLLQQYFGNAWTQAKKVMMCESGGNARAVGPMDSQGFQPIGLFQIKNFAGRPSTAALMDAATNIAYAAKMSGAGASWAAWQCKPW